MTETRPLLEAGVRDLLRESAEWRLLGCLFECPSEAWRADLGRLARDLDDGELGAAADAAIATATEGQYHSVFGPGGPAPPREVSYHETLELGSLMSELARYYDGFGYRSETREAPDHVAVEVGFISYLRLKQAYALAAGDTEHAELTARAADQFRSDHLTMIAEPLATLLEDSGLDYLARASRLLAARAGTRPVRRRLPMLPGPIDEEESEFGCADEQP